MTRLSIFAVLLVLLTLTSATFCQTISWPFCYSFTGGIGDGSRDGKIYSIVATGTFTTSSTGFNQTGNAGVQTAYNITGISGTRTYIDESGQSYPSNFVRVNSGVLYGNYPFLDTTGIVITLDSFVFNYDGNSTAKIINIVIDSSDMFDELITNTRTGAVSDEVVGNVDVKRGTENAANLQCAFNAGPSNVYNFCYGVSPDTGSSDQWNILTYGQFVGTGPILRKGQQVITMQTMTGVRTFTNSSLTQRTNILHLIYINGEELPSHGYILNDNLVFVSQTELDYYGFSYTTLLPPVFPMRPIYNNITDINLSMGSEFTFYEWPVSTGYARGAESTNNANYFNYSLASSGTFPCTVAVPAMINYYFCYQIDGSGYSIRASGTVTVFGSSMPVNGSTGYAIANITGTRSFTRNGQTSYSYFVGSSADSFGAVNNTYSQLFYPTAPHIDQLGVLIQVSSNTNTASGTVYGVPVIDLQLNGSNVTENAWTTGGQFTSSTGSLTATTSATALQYCTVTVNTKNGASQLSSVFTIISIIVIAVITMMA